jgi:hypothetical protein
LRQLNEGTPKWSSESSTISRWSVDEAKEALSPCDDQDQDGAKQQKKPAAISCPDQQETSVHSSLQLQSRESQWRRWKKKEEEIRDVSKKKIKRNAAA